MAAGGVWRAINGWKKTEETSMPCLITWKGLPIGEVTATGKTLCKKPFRTLKSVNRIRAYLLMVWPESRSNRTIAAVCGIQAKNIGHFLSTDLRDGVMEQPARGRWRAVPVSIESNEEETL